MKQKLFPSLFWLILLCLFAQASLAQVTLVNFVVDGIAAGGQTLQTSPARIVTYSLVVSKRSGTTVTGYIDLISAAGTTQIPVPGTRTQLQAQWTNQGAFDVQTISGTFFIDQSLNPSVRAGYIIYATYSDGSAGGSQLVTSAGVRLPLVISTTPPSGPPSLAAYLPCGSGTAICSNQCVPNGMAPTIIRGRILADGGNPS